jgi:hypothetical protein
MNLSRAAKKFRETEPKQSVTPKPVAPKGKAKAPAKDPAVPAEPVAAVIEAVAPVVEKVEAVPPATEPTPQPAVEPRPWPVKSKRSRFVRTKVEKRERVTLPPLVSGNTQAARLMTRNLASVPREELRGPTLR